MATSLNLSKAPKNIISLDHLDQIINNDNLKHYQTSFTNTSASTTIINSNNYFSANSTKIKTN